LALVDRLTSEHKTLEQLLAENGTEMHQGYITGARSKEVPAELHHLPCLTGGEMTPFEVRVDGLPEFAHTPEFEEGRIERPRDPNIYRGPLVLCASGLRGNRIAAALCREDVVYSRSQFGIPLGKGLMRFGNYINAVLNSSLATYFAFLTATRWGLDKYAIERTDFLQIPVPDFERAVSSIVDSITNIERELRRLARSGQYNASIAVDLDRAVFKLYGLDRFEQILVDDMVNQTIDFQRKHERSETLAAASPKECRAYAKSLIDVIQPFLETRKKRRLVAKVLDVDAPLRVVRFEIQPISSNGRPIIAVEKAADLSAVLREVAKNLDEKIAFGIHTRRHLRVYSGDAFYILKPAERRFWTRSAGLADGDSVLKDLFAGGGGE
jgi:hypothetical protein